ncbi:MAG: glutamate 5-kinase [Pseudomonadales bacterium]|nr:glutamate 5-kinase [Pseudomonadales bacterium]
MSQNEVGDANSVLDRESLARAARIVIKIGSALLTKQGLGLDSERISALSRQVANLVAAGREVVIVSSGAVAEGCNRLGWVTRPEAVHELQAAAAVGQMGLVEAWESALREHGRRAAMIMLTHEDFADRKRYLNARATILQLLSLGIVPVINENDTVATEEIQFGDNDTLAALVTNLIEGELLVILTDVDGLLSADPADDPDASVVKHAYANDNTLDRMAGKRSGVLGRGGMVTKLQAARLAARSGAHTVIASGQASAILRDVLSGREVGTWLQAELTPMTARKRWIAGHLRAKGALTIDAGAHSALVDQGVSLLAVGVTAVTGEFARGDVVRICATNGRQVGQGLSNYSSRDTAKLLGQKSEAFAEHIDYVGEPELVHRDNLVMV